MTEEPFQLEIYVDGIDSPFIELSDHAPSQLPAVDDELDIEMPSVQDNPFEMHHFVVYHRKFWMTGAVVYSVSLYVRKVDEEES